MEAVKGLYRRGFFHILGSTFLNKIVAFLANIAIVRILSKNDYGVFSGAFNVFFIVFLFYGFGITCCISARRIFPGKKKRTTMPGRCASGSGRTCC